MKEKEKKLNTRVYIDNLKPSHGITKLMFNLYLILTVQRTIAKSLNEARWLLTIRKAGARFCYGCMFQKAGDDWLCISVLNGAGY